MSLDEYLSYHDKFVDYNFIKNKKYAISLYGKKGKNGVLRVYTHAYNDSIYSPMRDYYVKEFRKKRESRDRAMTRSVKSTIFHLNHEPVP